MDGSSEFATDTDDCAKCVDCLAFRALLQEIVRCGEPDLYDVADDVVGWMEQQGEELSPKLRSRCVLAVADAARWLPTVTPRQILERAIAVDIDEDVIEDFCEMHSLSPDGGAEGEAPAAETVGKSTLENDDCANCPACRTRTLIYRELIELRFPMILPIAQTVVSGLTPEAVDEFGGADGALNSILLTAAEEFGRTSKASGIEQGRASITRSAEDLHFNDYDVAILLSVAMSLTESSGRLEHRG